MPACVRACRVRCRREVWGEEFLLVHGGINRWVVGQLAVSCNNEGITSLPAEEAARPGSEAACPARRARETSPLELLTPKCTQLSNSAATSKREGY